MKSVKLVEVFYHDIQVGKIAMTDKGLCAFEYAVEFLNNGFSISPFELPETECFIASRQPFNGNFGVFDDCLPDGWGMIIFTALFANKRISAK